MKRIDILFAILCGLMFGFLVSDFVAGFGIYLAWYGYLALWLVIPVISLMCLQAAYIIGKKFLFVYQVAKHLIVGAIVTIIDLKIFEFLLWFLSFFIIANPLVMKGISFIFSTFLKYLGNKNWAFEKNGKENIRQELFYFFIITLVGLAIDVAAFWYFVNILGPQFAIPSVAWIKLGVIFAAIIAALWNFLGYKFLVFKK